jgi:hypothetical protein
VCWDFRPIFASTKTWPSRDYLQALCALVAIALVHSDNRATAAIAMGIFATGVAVSIVLIASHGGPFSGQISVGPDLLLQVMPPQNP